VLTDERFRKVFTGQLLGREPFTKWGGLVLSKGKCAHQYTQDERIGVVR